jgi:hypothetical protein
VRQQRLFVLFLFLHNGCATVSTFFSADFARTLIKSRKLKKAYTELIDISPLLMLKTTAIVA